MKQIKDGYLTRKHFLQYVKRMTGAERLGITWERMVDEMVRVFVFFVLMLAFDDYVFGVCIGHCERS